MAERSRATAWVVALFISLCHVPAVCDGSVTHYVFGLDQAIRYDVCANDTLRLADINPGPSGSLTFTSPTASPVAIYPTGQQACGLAETNLIRNGDFESALSADNWQREPATSTWSMTRVSDRVGGAYGLRVTNTLAGEYHSVQLMQSVRLTAGQWYRLRFWAKSQANGWTIVVGTIHPTTYQNVGLWADPVLSTSWRLYEFLFQATATLPDARFSFYQGSWVGWISYDDVQIVPVDPTDECFETSSQLIANQGFECGVAGLHGWRIEDHFGGGILALDPLAHGGEACARIVPAQRGDYYQTQLQTRVSVVANQTYSFSGWGRASGPERTIVVGLNDPRTYDSLGLWFAPMLDSTWTSMFQVFTATRTLTDARLSLYVSAWAEPLWFDDFELSLASDAAKAPSIESKLPVTASTVFFDLPRAAAVQLQVFGVSGRLISSEARHLAAGRHAFVWDGHAESGRRATSGVYFLRIQSEGYAQTKKLMIVR